MPFQNIHPDVENEALAVIDMLPGSELVNIERGDGDTLNFTYRLNDAQVSFVTYDPCQLNARDLAVALITASAPVEVVPDPASEGALLVDEDVLDDTGTEDVDEPKKPSRNKAK